jgi:hypothetical protein
MLIENDIFCGNTLNQKVSWDIFEAFFDLKTKSVSVLPDLFPFFKMGLFKFHSRED